MTRPDARTVLNNLGFPGAAEFSPPGWDKAMAAMPAGPIPFLDKAALPTRLRAAGLEEGLAEPLSPVIDAATSDPSLRAFAWYMHWNIASATRSEALGFAPAIDPKRGWPVGRLYILLALEWPSRLAEYHRRQGYPPEVTVETIRQLRDFVEYHRKGEGVPGIYGDTYAWLGTYLRDPYVRLGRFEYRLQECDWNVNAWRRRADGALLVLAEDGARVADNGFLLDPGAPPDAGWTAGCRKTADGVTGCPIDPRGFVVQREVHLSSREWDELAPRGDTVLELHIPQGGRMDWTSVSDSLGRAAAFFPRYHPDRPFRALMTSTWFLDPQLEGILPPDSNPLRLQRAVYLCPVPPSSGGLWHVFQRRVFPGKYDQLPAATSLQRAIIGFLKSGGSWRGGSLVMLPEDMASPRENVYRERFAKLSPELGLAG